MSNVDRRTPFGSEKKCGIHISVKCVVNDLQIQRCYFKSTEKSMKIQLHGFSDASKIAYAAVIYMRSLYESGNIEVRLVASKSKVAPLKGQTIPRLELLGANILARLIATVQGCLFEDNYNNQEVEIINWTDSMTVLCWIANDKLWKQYVMHRVEEIRRLTSKDSWRFCPGTENPADLPSKPNCGGKVLSFSRNPKMNGQNVRQRNQIPH